MSAVELLEKAAGHLKDRAATYDNPEGERSISAAVEAFRAITGDGIMNTGERGWLFMAILKMVRSQQGNYRADNYEDGAAYFALMGESACEERNGEKENGVNNAKQWKYFEFEQCPKCGNDVEVLTDAPLGCVQDGDKVRCVDAECGFKSCTSVDDEEIWIQDA